MDEDFTWPFSDGCLQSGTRHSERRRPRYRLEKFAAAFRRVAPDFYAVGSIGRLGSATSAAFAQGVTEIGAVADEIDALPVLHDTRSYFGFQPREMPFDIRLLAMKS